MRKYLKFVDNFVRKYLGLNRQNTTPSIVNYNKNKLTIISTESYKRHTHSNDINDFISCKLDNLNESNKLKLGSALGKAIAKNLTISFENITVKKAT